MGKLFDAIERHRKESVLDTGAGFADKDRNRKTREVLSVESAAGGQDVRQVLLGPSAYDSMDAENFRKLRAHILSAKNSENRLKCIMVTSAYPGEGKTFVAANLGVSIALGIDEHVLMVDCDLRNPHLHAMLDCPNGAGLHEHLVENIPLSELILRTRIDKLSLLPGGTLPCNPSELIASNLMEAFLEEVKSRYPDRYIVIDSTPSFITAEAQVLARKADGIILVVMAGKSPRKAVQKTIENLGSDKIIGVVFNGYDQPLNGYGKYYRGYYHGKQ